MTSKVFSGSPVPRQYVFIMADGAFVVQWDEARVQDLLTGRYRPFSRDHFGHPITDYELSQLKAAGRVEHFNRIYVWLYALPEGKRFDVELKTIQRMRDRVRTYYLNTTLPKAQLSNIQALLVSLGFEQELSAQERSHLVAILGRDGAPFLHFAEVEGVQRQLVLRAPEVFRNSVVAFIEGNRADMQSGLDKEQTVEPNDLETVIASQTDTTLTQGKCVVVVGSNDEEQFSIVELCQEMGMAIQAAPTAGQALQLLEDLVPDLLIMDLHLTDMHGWEMLAKAREINSLRNLPVIVIADQSAAPNQQSFALTVAKVDVYLVKPVSTAKLRQNIWMVIKQHAG